MALKVLYDHQKFSLQRAGGITRYFAELFDNFSPEIKPMVSLKFNRNIYISGKKELFLRSVTDYDFHFRGNRYFASFLDMVNKAYSVHDYNNCEYDIFHPTYYGCYFMKHEKRRPVVVTIHDMIQELFPNDFDKAVIEDKKRQIFESDHIVAVSRHTKRDILKIYPEISPEKISVIYHGTSFMDMQPVRMSTPTKYILFVGRRDGYKNFSVFLTAMIPLLRKAGDLKVVCVGEVFKPVERKFLVENSLEDKVLCTRANDAQLLSLYMNAEVFVFPSVYEGFGLPILEAFRAGCPVCLSDASCFPEIAEEAAVYFNPATPESITEAVSRCMTDRDLRKVMIERGRRRLGNFTWKKSASELEILYRSIV